MTLGARRGIAAVEHRPWPPPRGPWVMRQAWREVLFAHWPLPPDALRRVVPPALELDTLEGRAWIAVVPFRMTGIRPRFVPPLPGLSAFAELNLRTYVTFRGEKPGVYFFSLDAASPIAVRIARSLFHLPYYDADMSYRRDGDTIRYRSRRTHRGASPAELRARYRPVGAAARSESGSLESWLTERYCLYAVAGDRVWRGEIHHEPWPLQPAEIELETCSLTEGLDLALQGPPPVAHYAERVDVAIWLPQRLG